MQSDNFLRETRESGRIIATAGMSQSGKTTQIKKDTLQHDRLVVWDVRGEWPADPAVKVERLVNRQQLWEALADQYAGRYAYVPDGNNLQEEFDQFCKLAYLWGQMHPATIIADELADVTTPSKAPDGWGQLLRKGKLYGNLIYGISQFPTESDKTTWRNADILRCFVVVADEDRAYMARRMGVSADQIPGEKYQYIEKRVGQMEAKLHKSG